MEVLCVGGTGRVGHLVVDGLIERGADVRCLARSPGRSDAAGGRVTHVRGDLGDPASLDAAFEGVDRVHLLTPLHPNETELGRNAIDAAMMPRSARVRRFPVVAAVGVSASDIIQLAAVQRLRY